MIKVKSLNKYYNKGKSNQLHVINDTTIELPDTGLVCILGESGSGKTTLMNTVSGLDDFSGGTIEVDGVEIKKYGDVNQERVRNEKFGYIFQNYYLLQDRTVEYNLMISLGLYDISDSEKEERIDYVLKAVDMWRYKKRLVSQLSGGQQQRIAIARALAKSPGIIFADEPTGNLDEANTMRIMGILKKISDTCLVVLVTHEKSIADFFADRTLWITDGRIVDDKTGREKNTYTYVEDTNLYLGEYERRDIKSENVSLEIYDGGEKPSVEIKVICDNGKIYISVGENKNVELLTAESEKQVLEGTKPVIEMADVDSMEYSLEQLEYAKKPRLSFKEIKNIAVDNIKVMGKKQIFLAAALIAMAVMMVLAIQDIITIVSVHEEEVVETDSHYMEVIMEKGGMISNSDFLQLKKKYMAKIKDNETVGGMTVMNPDTSLQYVYSGFTQLEKFKATVKDFSFVPIEKLSEDELLYGEMPENDSEIVVDEWVLNRFIENSNELSNVITNIKHFVGKTLETSDGRKFTVSGISRSEEMDIYIGRDAISTVVNIKTMNPFITYSEYEEKYGKSYEGEKPGYNSEEELYEILVPKSEFVANYNIYAKSAHYRIEEYEDAREVFNEYNSWYLETLQYLEMGYLNGKDDTEEMVRDAKERKEKAEQAADAARKEMLDYYGVDTYDECCAIRDDYTGYKYEKEIKTGGKYLVIGFFDSMLEDSDVPADIVMADEALRYVDSDVMASMSKFYVYVEDGDSAENIKAHFEQLAKETGTGINLNITNPYDEALKEYKSEKSLQFNARIIVTCTIFIVSMLILYFMMKTNAIQRMGDLAVYRLIGISKGSILGLFAFENALITTYTSLVGAVLTTLVTYVIGNIPSLEIKIDYPWYAFLLTVVFLYIVNIVIGILPIRKILKLPPAQLASKYDI